MTNSETVISHSSGETFNIAKKFAQQLEPGAVVTLYGDLGSGKTTFVKGICKTFEVRDNVSSPTFTLINEYSGRLPIYHFDFYRIENLHEIWQLGCEEYFQGDGICLIEWAEKVEELLPEKRIEIRLQHVAPECPDQRKITIKAT